MALSCMLRRSVRLAAVACAVAWLPALALGPWGVELPTYNSDCSQGSHANPGLFGCKWFNYSNAFVKGTTKWYWSSAENVTSVNWCIYGSIASVMLEQRWPDYSYFEGLDRSDQDKRIQHTWSFDEILSMGCQTHPSTVQLADGSCSPYDYADDEVTRLYVAAHAASHCGSSYSNILSPSNHHRLRWVFRNKLGFPDASHMSVGAYGAIGAVHYEVNAGNPVVVLCNGHAFTIDASRQTGSGYYDFHVANYASYCRDGHNSYWMSVTDLLNGATGYTPSTFCFPGSSTFSVSASSLRTKGFPFGDDYMRETSNTNRYCCVRIQNISASPGAYRVVVKTTDGLVLSDSDFSGGGFCWTPWRLYSVGTSRILNVEVHNNSGTTQEYRLVVQDWRS